MKAKLISIFLFLLLIPFTAEAQCSMCRAVLESQGQTDTAEGLNNGIIYLMAFPYLLMAGVAYFVWKSRKKQKSEQP